jgi:hypothetical protein
MLMLAAAATLTVCLSPTLQRLQQAPARIAQLWDLAGLGLNFTGLSVAETDSLTVPGQLAALGVRLDNSTAVLEA